MSLDETCIEGNTVQYLSDVYRNKIQLKQDVVSALLRFKCAFVTPLERFHHIRRE